MVSDTIPSRIYGTAVAVTLYLPPCYTTRMIHLPVIYLLHGANTDQTQWPDLNLRTSADKVISRTRTSFVVVMPGGEYRYDVDYDAFVLDDLIPAVESRYNVSTNPNQRAIGGISMGGYYALRLAFQHPEMFAAVGGHSPVVTLGGVDDPLDLARRAKELGWLRVWLDAGDQDPLRAGAADLAAVLQARSVAVTFSVNPGAHDRPYWRAHSEEYLDFYANAITTTASVANFIANEQRWLCMVSPLWPFELSTDYVCPQP